MLDSTNSPDNDNPIDFFGIEPGQTSDDFINEHGSPKSLEKLWYLKGYTTASEDNARLQKVIASQTRIITYLKAKIADHQKTDRIAEKLEELKLKAVERSRPDKPHYIYIIKHPITGNFKIGISHNPKKRAEGLLQSAKAVDPAFSGKFTVVHTHKVMGKTLAHKIEQQAHSAFRRSCVGGEWFRIPEESLHLVRQFIWHQIDNNGDYVDLQADGLPNWSWYTEW
jgi:predicted GIY-YIG superfamily endonuclease